MSSVKTQIKKKNASPGAAGGADIGATVPGRADAYVATVLARKMFTRERHMLMVRVISGISGALVLSLALNFYQATRPVPMHWIPTNSDGKLLELSSLDKPLHTLPEVSTWLTEAVMQTYTYDFSNYQQQLGNAQANFTPAGWRGFERALSESGNLKSVIANQYVTKVVPLEAPTLKTEGLVEGRHAWKFEFPIQIMYESAKQKTSQTLKIKALVVRMPETEQAQGLAIASLIAE